MSKEKNKRAIEKLLRSIRKFGDYDGSKRKKLAKLGVIVDPAPKKGR